MGQDVLGAGKLLLSTGTKEEGGNFGEVSRWEKNPEQTQGKEGGQTWDILKRY